MLFTDLSLAFNLHVNSTTKNIHSLTHNIPSKCNPSTILCEHSITYPTVYAYSQSNYLFVTEFFKAFVKMSNIEYKYYSIDSTTLLNPTGRLGELTYLNETECLLM